METLETWVSIIIPLLSLLAGSGWLKFYLESRDKKREKWRGVLKGFLLPFESIMKHNYLIFEELTDDDRLRALEYAPDYLQKHFSELPDSDPLKITWTRRIVRLIAENKRAVDLIEENIGNMITKEFKDKCDDFKFHAEHWEDLWNAIMGPDPISLDSPVMGYLVDPEARPRGRFPKNLDLALQNEIAEVKRLAGELVR